MYIMSHLQGAEEPGAEGPRAGRRRDAGTEDGGGRGPHLRGQVAQRHGHPDEI